MCAKASTKTHWIELYYSSRCYPNITSLWNDKSEGGKGDVTEKRKGKWKLCFYDGDFIPHQTHTYTENIMAGLLNCVCHGAILVHMVMGIICFLIYIGFSTFLFPSFSFIWEILSCSIPCLSYFILSVLVWLHMAVIVYIREALFYLDVVACSNGFNELMDAHLLYSYFSLLCPIICCLWSSSSTR